MPATLVPPLPFRFCSFFRRSEVEQELRDELHDHLEGKTRWRSRRRASF